VRIVQLCYEFVPRSIATNGGELRYWQDLASLSALGHEVHLVVVNSKDSEVGEDVRALTESVRFVKDEAGIPSLQRRLMSLVDDASAFDLLLPVPGPTRGHIARVAEELKPDLIWAGWIGSMAIAPEGLPIVYSHTDFIHRVKRVRRKWAGGDKPQRWPDRTRQARMGRWELHLATKARQVICVSASEAADLKSRGVPATYIPIVGPTEPKPDTGPADKARFFFFGTWACTALRTSVREFRNRIWPGVQAWSESAEWHQVGKPEPRDTDDWRWFQTVFNCHGFVSELNSVFRPGDASLVPYTEDTGFRTKFTVGAAHGVVNVGYRGSFDCAPEFSDGIDCLMADSPEHYAELLHRFSQDRAMRAQLGEGSRALYDRAFRFDSHLSTYDTVLKNGLAAKVA
jgi:glycosyltransferase involved in cell wall biosynthesis